MRYNLNHVKPISTEWSPVAAFAASDRDVSFAQSAKSRIVAFGKGGSF